MFRWTIIGIVGFLVFVFTRIPQMNWVGMTEDRRNAG